MIRAETLSFQNFGIPTITDTFDIYEINVSMTLMLSIIEAIFT